MNYESTYIILDIQTLDRDYIKEIVVITFEVEHG